MKYLEKEELKIDAYYLIRTYDGEFAVLKYLGDEDEPWGLNQTWGQIRFVLREVDAWTL